MDREEYRNIFTQAANAMAHALEPDSYARAWINDDAWDSDNAEALITGESEIRIGMLALMALAEPPGMLGQSAYALVKGGIPECDIRFTLYSRFDAYGIENGITVFMEPESEMEFRQDVLDFVLDESRLSANANIAEYEASLRGLVQKFKETVSPMQDDDSSPTP